MGAWQEIVDYTVPSNTTSVVLDNFGTITKDDFVRIDFTLLTSASPNSPVFLHPNGQTTNTNYHRQNLIGQGSSVFANRSNDPELFFTNQNSSSFSVTYVKLSENDRFNSFTNLPAEINSNIDINFRYTTSSGVTFPSGITSFTFTGFRTNGIGTGSRIQIYKLAAEKVADITVASNTTQVDISNLSIDKDSEYLLVSDTPSASANFQLFPNDLTTATNYYNQVIFGTGSTAGANRANNALIGDAGSLIYIHIKLSNIGAYTYQAYELRGKGTSSPLVVNFFGSSTAENITSITKLNIVASSTDAIQAGSKFTLYKLY